MFITTSYNRHQKLAHTHSKSTKDSSIKIFDKNGNIINYTSIINPAFVYEENDLLYILTETVDDNGYIFIFDKLLNLKEMKRLEGKSSCHINKYQNKYIITHYWDGKVQILNNNLETEKTFLQWNKNINYRELKNKLDHSMNRQVGPHPHCSMIFKDLLLISNLGNDMIYIYDKLFREIIKIKLPNGVGPRNLVQYNNFIYTANELNNSISIIEYKNKEFIIKDTIKNSKNKGDPSEIKIFEDNLFISIRTENVIVWYKIQEDGSILKNLIYKTDNCPRSFDISKDGKEMIIGCQKDDNVKIYKIDYLNNKIIFKKEIKVECPNYVKYISF
jgi:6-phosphogluconolactonase